MKHYFKIARPAGSEIGSGLLAALCDRPGPLVPHTPCDVIRSDLFEDPFEVDCPQCLEALGEPWPTIERRRHELSRTPGGQLRALLREEIARPPAADLALPLPRGGWSLTRAGARAVLEYDRALDDLQDEARHAQEALP